MTTPITIKKKEVIATLAERKIKEELKNKDFYKIFLDKIKDREICEGDQIAFGYSIQLKYEVTMNKFEASTSEMLAMIPFKG